MQLQTYHFREHLFQVLLIDNRLGVITQELGRILGFSNDGAELLEFLKDTTGFVEGNHYCHLTPGQVETLHSLQLSQGLLALDEDADTLPPGVVGPTECGAASASVIYSNGLDRLLGMSGIYIGDFTPPIIMAPSIHSKTMGKFHRQFRYEVGHDIVWNWVSGEASPVGKESEWELSSFPEDGHSSPPRFEDYADSELSTTTLERLGDKILEAGAKEEGVDVLLAAARLLAPEGSIKRRHFSGANKPRGKVKASRGLEFTALSKLMDEDSPSLKEREHNALLQQILASSKKLKDLRKKHKACHLAYSSRRGRLNALQRAMAGDMNGIPKPRLPRATPLFPHPGLGGGLFILNLGAVPGMAQADLNQCEATADEDRLMVLALNYQGAELVEPKEWVARFKSAGIRPEMLTTPGESDEEKVAAWLQKHLGTTVNLNGRPLVLAEGYSKTNQTPATIGFVPDTPVDAPIH